MISIKLQSDREFIQDYDSLKTSQKKLQSDLDLERQQRIEQQEYTLFTCIKYILISTVFSYKISQSSPRHCENIIINHSFYQGKKKPQHLEQLNGLLKTRKLIHTYSLTHSILLHNHLSSYEMPGTWYTAVNKDPFFMELSFYNILNESWISRKQGQVHSRQVKR